MMDIEKQIAQTLLDIDTEIDVKFKGYFYRNPICEGWPLVRQLFPLQSPMHAPILDVGCGNGGLLFYLWHAGFRNLHGSDIGKQKLAWAQALHARHGVLSALTLSSLLDSVTGRFAVIFAIGFLYEEHGTLQTFLMQARQHLMPDGQIIFNWPTWEKPTRPLRPYYSESQVTQIAHDCGLTADARFWSKTQNHTTALFVCEEN